LGPLPRWRGSALPPSLRPASFHFLPGDAAIGPASGIQQTPAIARGGDKLLVVWTDGRGNGTGGSEYETASDIYGMRISPEGVVLDPPTRVIVPRTYQRSNFKLTYAAGVFLLTFDGAYERHLHHRVCSVRQQPQCPGPTPGTLLLFPECLAASDTGFYIAWNRQEPDYSVVVAGSRVGPTGVRLDGNGVNLSGTKQPYAYSPTAVNWDGLNWRVTWGVRHRLGGRVSAAGRGARSRKRGHHPHAQRPDGRYRQRLRADGLASLCRRRQ
jgi:hypothetical protein